MRTSLVRSPRVRTRRNNESPLPEGTYSSAEPPMKFNQNWPKYGQVVLSPIGGQTWTFNDSSLGRLDCFYDSGDGYLTHYAQINGQPYPLVEVNPDRLNDGRARFYHDWPFDLQGNPKNKKVPEVKGKPEIIYAPQSDEDADKGAPKEVIFLGFKASEKELKARNNTDRDQNIYLVVEAKSEDGNDYAKVLIPLQKMNVDGVDMWKFVFKWFKGNGWGPHKDDQIYEGQPGYGTELFERTMIIPVESSPEEPKNFFAHCMNPQDVSLYLFLVKTFLSVNEALSGEMPAGLFENPRRGVHSRRPGRSSRY